MLAEALGLSDDEQMAFLAYEISKSDLDFLALIRETMDDLAGTPLSLELIWPEP